VILSLARVARLMPVVRRWVAAVALGPGVAALLIPGLHPVPADGAAPVVAGAVGLAAGERFDHGEWDALLRAHVHHGLVDYEGFLADRGRLDAYLARVAAADIRDWPEPELKAFWINAYNAIMIGSVLDAWPVDSVLHIHRILGLVPTGGVFRERHTVARLPRSLDDLEHHILRARYQDPRIHAALNCASMSCPVLQPWAYEGSRLNDQLDTVMREFVLDPERNRLDHRPPQLSSIFSWYGEDFEAAAGSVWAYVLEWVTPQRRASLPAQANPGFLSYDWSLNTAPQ